MFTRRIRTTPLPSQHVVRSQSPAHTAERLWAAGEHNYSSPRLSLPHSQHRLPAVAGALVLFSSLISTAVAAEDESSSDLFSGLPVEVQLILLLLLIALSGIFCGLTLGVMGMDTNSLEIIAEAGQEPDRSFAQELLPIRKLGHQSLSTLILGNMLANVLISQLVSDLTPSGDSAGIVSFIIATLVILIFAEVLPMSVCKGPHALEIACAGVPILRAFLVILYPIAKPLGLLLDLITPHDAGQIYDRNELRKLMRVHCEAHGDRSGLDSTELKMLLGAMDFHEGIVGRIMTPIGSVFMIEDTTIANRELVESLWREGKSRVPIFHEQRNNIIGILFVKDLVSMLAFRSVSESKGTSLHQHVATSQHQQDVTVGTLVGNSSRDLIRVRYSATLPSVLRMFQSGNLHLLLVEEDPDLNGASYGRYVGIVTVEDVIEELIKSEIRDEYDDEVSSDEEVLLGAGEENGNQSSSSGKQHGNRVGNSHSDVEEPSAPPPTMGATAPFGSNAGSPTSLFTVLSNNSLAIASATIAGNGVTGRRKIVVPKLVGKLPRINFSSFYITGSPLSDGHRWVLADYLQRAVGVFATWKVSHIKLLLDEVGDREVLPLSSADIPSSLQHEGSLSDQPTLTGSGSSSFHKNVSASMFTAPNHPASGPQLPNGLRGAAGHRTLSEQTRRDLVLYEFEKRSTMMTLVLSGGVRLLVGEDLFNHECRTFTLLGESAICAQYSKDYVRKDSPLGPLTMFIPDFTAIVSRPSRLLCISQQDYERVDGYFQRGSAGRGVNPSSFAAPPSSSHHRTSSHMLQQQRMLSEDQRHRSEMIEQMT